MLLKLARRISIICHKQNRNEIIIMSFCHFFDTCCLLLMERFAVALRYIIKCIIWLSVTLESKYLYNKYIYNEYK